LQEHQTKARLSAVKDEFSQSQKMADTGTVEDYQRRIQDTSTKPRDQRVDADTRMARQQKEHEAQLKQLRSEMTLLQVEKNKELQKQHEDFEASIATVISKSASNENEMHKLRVELAHNIEAKKDYESRLSECMQSSMNFSQRRARFTSHNKALLEDAPESDKSGNKRRTKSPSKSQACESFGDTTDIFERDENAEINISQSLRLGHSKGRTVKAKNKSGESVRSPGGRSRTKGLTGIFEDVGEARNDLEDVELVLDNGQDGVNDIINGKETLQYSLGTGTLGASSINFGFSASKSFFQNDLRLQAAVLQQRQQEQLKEQLDKNLNMSNISENLSDNKQHAEQNEDQQPANAEIAGNLEVFEVDTDQNTTVNFNLTQTQMHLGGSLPMQKESQSNQMATTGQGIDIQGQSLDSGLAPMIDTQLISPSKSPAINSPTNDKSLTKTMNQG